MKAKMFALIAIVCCLQNTYASASAKATSSPKGAMPYAVVVTQVGTLAAAATPKSFLATVLSEVSTELSSKQSQLAYGPTAQQNIDYIRGHNNYNKLNSPTTNRRAGIIEILTGVVNPKDCKTTIFVDPSDPKTFAKNNSGISLSDKTRLGAALLALQALAPAK